MVEELFMAVLQCSYCGAEVYIQDEYVRDKIFCTIRCMDLSEANEDGGKLLIPCCA